MGFFTVWYGFCIRMSVHDVVPWAALAGAVLLFMVAPIIENRKFKTVHLSDTTSARLSKAGAHCEEGDGVKSQNPPARRQSPPPSAAWQ
jgi:hypothetical protein